jgi:hypothetical protein
VRLPAADTTRAVTAQLEHRYEQTCASSSVNPSSDEGSNSDVRSD